MDYSTDTMLEARNVDVVTVSSISSWSKNIQRVWTWLMTAWKRKWGILWTLKFAKNIILSGDNSRGLLFGDQRSYFLCEEKNNWCLSTETIPYCWSYLNLSFKQEKSYLTITEAISKLTAVSYPISDLVYYLKATTVQGTFIFCWFWGPQQ